MMKSPHLLGSTSCVGARKVGLEDLTGEKVKITLPPKHEAAKVLWATQLGHALYKHTGTTF